MECTDIRETNSQNQVLAIWPISYSFPKTFDPKGSSGHSGGGEDKKGESEKDSFSTLDWGVTKLETG